MDCKDSMQIFHSRKVACLMLKSLEGYLFMNVYCKREPPHPPQLSPEIFDPRKVDPKYLEANFEYFILSTMNRTVQAIF